MISVDNLATYPQIFGARAPLFVEQEVFVGLFGAGEALGYDLFVVDLLILGLEDFASRGVGYGWQGDIIPAHDVNRAARAANAQDVERPALLWLVSWAHQLAKRVAAADEVFGRVRGRER